MTGEQSQGVYIDLASLMRLKYSARGFSYLPHQPVRSLLSGRKRSRLRGRGLDFDELRHYRPGDDIRTMDWRVTNRTGKPHVRVYTEERDRPVIVVVDQRLPMFFGSEVKMKSVVAAEIAALTAWRVMNSGDRVGAILFNDTHSVKIKPSRSEKKTIHWLGDLVEMNNDLSVTPGHDSNPGALTDALLLLERSVGHDYLVVLISDFYGWNESSMGVIQRISRHNDIICSLVYDPLEQSISNAHSLIISDGSYQLEVDPTQHNIGDRFEASFRSSVTHVTEDLRQHNIPVLTVDTVVPVTDQLRQKLGGQRILQ
ncbi:MAG: hypothetical protein ACI8QT_001473 [Halioglobus sp.]|jgi:uncharacterized protein (DUF58 family)